MILAACIIGGALVAVLLVLIGIRLGEAEPTPLTDAHRLQVTWEIRKQWAEAEGPGALPRVMYRYELQAERRLREGGHGA